MKTITLRDIKILAPCYNPDRHLEGAEEDETWTGTILDILKADNVPIIDRLWVVLRLDFVSEDILSKFIEFCGGGQTAFSAATEQLRINLNNTEDKDIIVKNIQNLQLQKLIELIILEN